MGANCKAKHEDETPTVNTSVLMVTSSMNSLKDSESAKEVGVTTNTDWVTIAVENHFLVELQSKGFSGSSS